MIKKIFIILLLLLTCVSCEKIDYTYDISYIDVDMSEYEGMNSTQHMFRAVTVQELFNCIDNKSSGVFYLGRINCGCCQICVKYLNQAATDLGVYVNYIDVYDERMPITTQELMDELKLYLFDILEVDEEGKRELQTPTVFSVINGEIVDHMICLDGNKFDEPPTKLQETILVSKYKSLLKPFAK